MTVIYYTEKDYKKGICFLGRIQCLFPEMILEIVTTVHSLMNRLRMSVTGVSVLILAVDTRQRLVELLDVADRVSSFRVILILPERKKELISQALMLVPKYIGYADTDLCDMEAVLAKILLMEAQEEEGRGIF